MKRLLSKLYDDQELDSLLTWDFGVGLTETETENELQKQRKTFRPVVVRQTILESHSEIPRRIEGNTSYQSWHEFDMPYKRLKDKSTHWNCLLHWSNKQLSRFGSLKALWKA